MLKMYFFFMLSDLNKNIMQYLITNNEIPVLKLLYLPLQMNFIDTAKNRIPLKRLCSFPWCTETLKAMWHFQLSEKLDLNLGVRNAAYITEEQDVL